MSLFDVGDSVVSSDVTSVVVAAALDCAVVTGFCVDAVVVSAAVDIYCVDV